MIGLRIYICIYRWSLIAGRLPGRTANDVKNFWHTNMRHNNKEGEENKGAKVTIKQEEKREDIKDGHVVIKPRPHTFSKNSPWLRKNKNYDDKLVSACVSASTCESSSFAQPCPLPLPADFRKIESDEWWERLLNQGDDEVDEEAIWEFYFDGVL